MKKKQKQKFSPEQEKYLKAYFENEADANKHMTFANTLTAGFLLILFFLYLFRVFDLHEAQRLFILIAFPIAIGILTSPLIFYFFHRKSLSKPNFKYFVVFSFVFVTALLYIIIPKHVLLAWALCIIIVNHYYNPKLGWLVFGVSMVSLLLAMYASMFVGEYDPHFLGNGVIIVDEIVYIDGISERYAMLHRMLLEGENRYLKVFLYYYLTRGAVLALIFFVSNSLNMRTYKLLTKEIHVSSEQQKTKTELEVAKEIQINTLPVEFVTNKDIEIQAELKAAKEVGGDFYDYYMLDDEHAAIVIADVSGKGIPAAMLMMKTITCFKNYISVKKTPAEIMRLVNKAIYEGNDSKMFVTAFLAIINTKNGLVKFANAGHNPPLVGSYPNFRFLKCSSGFVLGGLQEAFVTDEEFTLQNGEQITLYTDGITEAMNEKREQYGEDRFLALANAKEYSCLLEFHLELKDDIYKFVGNAEQSDDMTYITLKYHGDKYEYKEKMFKATQEEIPNMLGFFEEFSNEYKFEKSFVNNLKVVGDELLSNVVKYSYEDSNENIYLRLLYNIDRKEFIITIIDTGKEFNPFDVENAPVDENYKNREPGGLGILIVKKLMSEYAYDRVNNKNIVTLKKRF